MALTQADPDRLETAIANAELEVEQDGTRVRYASFADLRARREFVAGVVAAGAASAGGTSRLSFGFEFTTSRGD